MKILSLLLLITLPFGILAVGEELSESGLRGSNNVNQNDDETHRHLQAPFDPRRVKVLVQFKNEQGKEKATRKAASVGYESERFKFVAMEIDEREMAALENDPNIASVSLDQEKHIIFPIELGKQVSVQGGKPGKKQKPPQKSKTSRGSRRQLLQQVPWGIPAVEANQVTPGSDASDITICVVDTGYDINHEDLPQGDDVNGTDNTKYGIEGGIWYFDGYGHGTHCAGTVGANGMNDEGVTGVIPNIDVNGIKLHIGKGLANDGYGSEAGVLEAVDHCIDVGAKVISLSLGGGGWSQLEYDTYKEAYEDHDVLIVAAAANDGDSSYSYPASYDSVMSVAAVSNAAEYDFPYTRAYFTNFNNQVEIAGPGVDVLSTLPGNSYSEWSGTSMATPHVAAVAALLWSHNSTCSAKQIRKILLATTLPLADGGCDEVYGRGMVQAKAAVDMLVSGGCDAAENLGIFNDSDGYNVGNVCDNAPFLERCGPGRQEILTLGLILDSKPGETSWVLRNDGNGQVIASGGPYTANDPSIVQQQIPVCLGRTYTFTMSDSGGDGLSGGPAGYFLHLKGDAYAKIIRNYGAMAGSAEEITLLPRGCPEGQEVVLINVHLDWYPEETSFELRHAETGEQVMSASYVEDDYSEFFYYNTCVDTGGTYNFTIYDTFGDGICCQWGSGSYSVMYGPGVILKEDDGAFLSSETTTFTVSKEQEPPTVMPSFMPSSSPSKTPTVGTGCLSDDDCNQAVPPFVCPSFKCNVGTGICEQTCNCDYSCDAGETATTCPSGCTNLSELTTAMDATNQQAGNMFKIQVQRTSNLQLLGFDFFARVPNSPFQALVFHKEGDFVGFENNPAAWTLLQQSSGTTNQAANAFTELPPLGTKSIILQRGTVHSFYVTLTNGGMLRYSNGKQVGAEYRKNGDFVFYEGYGKAYPFAGTFQPRVWNGKIKYVRVP